MFQSFLIISLNGVVWMDKRFRGQKISSVKIYKKSRNNFGVLLIVDFSYVGLNIAPKCKKNKYGPLK